MPTLQSTPGRHIDLLPAGALLALLAVLLLGWRPDGCTAVMVLLVWVAVGLVVAWGLERWGR